MSTDGDLGPTNSPLGSEHGDDGSQYGNQRGSGAGNQDSPPPEGSLEDKVLKMVSATVKGLI
eukprot:6915096-Karenia_brevis.AAC.1